MPTSDRTVPEARIFVNNAQLPVDLRADLLDLVVTQHVEGGDSFEITFNTLDSNNQRLKWNDSTLLAPGSVLEVQVGYQGTFDSLIVGEVTGLPYQQDLMTFSARLSTARQVSEVRVRGWNPSAKSAILGVAHAGDETTRMGGDTLGPVLSERAFGAQTTAVVHTPVRSQA